ncbi:hypothetical protein HZ326_15393 [Fusarium oxysporum f. sp. albedinis]|nr:hypothetical protein HZ326_15393 [Fusarium oxysporum f. sp. albedinis]
MCWKLPYAQISVNLLQIQCFGSYGVHLPPWRLLAMRFGAEPQYQKNNENPRAYLSTSSPTTSHHLQLRQHLTISSSWAVRVKMPKIPLCSSRFSSVSKTIATWCSHLKPNGQAPKAKWNVVNIHYSTQIQTAGEKPGEK